VVQDGDPFLDPLFSTFSEKPWKRIRDIPEVKKSGQKTGFLGGSKNGIFGKTEILLCRERRFFRFFVVFFCDFLVIFVNFGTPLRNWPLWDHFLGSDLDTET
jgi:hypothetical protein